ncbi:helix-turn-helix domain-containing protein [Xenorhabdus sp. PB30.3]|uniref:helix-turn-helix domain-containing protein n=1 Tax=Xenorhabdus sp. PB30.3 TaxID=2788941 RepID=UPI001E60276A|nr:helix-turn-helix transcriptional regulator [Xenorhabdus sp. PB30.3]MCC8379539.1 helix-turn-helix transcriptional regulator [Xenorhabdus sp. PB30.3]
MRNQHLVKKHSDTILKKKTNQIISEEQINRFGERLKIAMNGMSNNAFAKQCCWSEKMIRNYLNGESYPSLDRLAVIANVSGCSIGWLATGENDNSIDHEDISDQKNHEVSTIGARLKEVRSHRKLNQTEFAALIGCSRGTQAYYERDERVPDANYLAALVNLGIDVMYVLTGIKSDLPKITVEEQKLIEHYRTMNEKYRENLQVVSSAFAQLSVDK